MAVNFDVRADDSGWTVFDRRTGEPVLVERAPQVGLPRACAEQLADDLNEPRCLVWRNISIIGP